MKYLITLAIGFSISLILSAQSDRLSEHIRKGISLHDEGKYEEAIEEYHAALSIDSTSTTANYELSYTCMVSGRYADAVKYCRKVVEQDADNQEAAYISLGSSYDMLGDPENAIKAYDEGLVKFPESNLLNYNLAYTLYNQKQYDRAELAAINAIILKPGHASSHCILSAIMEGKGERVKSILPLYYFLLVEPSSKRSETNYYQLKEKLGRGVERTGKKKIDVRVPLCSYNDSLFAAAEMFISLQAANVFLDENKNKSEMENFVESTKGLFGMLGELKKENSGFWWDFYVTLFDDLEKSDNCEAFCYYISQSANTDEINNWFVNNSDKMQKLRDWFEN